MAKVGENPAQEEAREIMGRSTESFHHCENFVLFLAMGSHLEMLNNGRTFK